MEKTDHVRCWNFEQSMGARNRVGRGLSYLPARDGIFKLLRSPGIDSKGPRFRQPVYPGGPVRQSFPTRFPALIDCSKFQHRLHRLSESIPGVLKSFKILS